MPRTTTQTLTHSLARPALPQVSRLIAGLGLTLAQIDHRRRTRRALAQLDAHLLRDIGLTDTARAAECGKAPWAD